MRPLLNTLFVTTENAYISKDGLNIVVSVQQKEIFRIPVLNIEQIITFGYIGASPGLMKLCADHNVALTFLSPNGRFICRSQGPTKGNVLLRKAQYTLSDNQDYSLHLCKMFIAGKIQNYRNILQRSIRDNGDNVAIESSIASLKRYKELTLRADNINSIRGFEGEAAMCYFSVFSNLILWQKRDFKFIGRNRRPPKDPINTMLSFVYTLICNDVTAALETVGLDPYVGFMHTLRPGRPSLSLDLMEELRAYLGDRLVLSLINRKQITINDFNKQSDEAIILTEKGRKTILTAWQSRKKEQIVHPYLNEKINIGLLPYAQALLLARYIRKDLDDYPVFLIK